MKLGPKLTGLFLLLSVVPLAIVGFLAYKNGRQTIKQDTVNRLISTNTLKAAELNRWVDDNQRSLRALARRPLVRDYATALVTHEPDEPAYQTARTVVVADHFAPTIEEAGGFEDLSILHPGNGRIMVSTHAPLEGRYREEEPFFLNGQRDTFVGDVVYELSLQDIVMHVSTPIRDSGGDLVAVLAGHVNLDEMTSIVNQRTGLSSTQESYLVNKFNFFVTEPRLGEASPLQKAIHTEGVEACLTQEDGVGTYIDYRGIPVMGAYRWMPQRELCVLTEVDQAEAFAPIISLRNSVSGIGLAVALGVAVLGVVFARTVTDPVQQLLRGTHEIGRGNLDYRIDVQADDEIGELAAAFNAMTAQRQHAETTLREQQTFLESIYTGIELAIFVVDVTLDGDFRYVSLNPAHERLTGFKSADIQGKTPDALVPRVPPDAAAAIRANYARCAREGEPVQYEEMIPMGERETWWLTRLTPLQDADGRVYRIIGTSLEISERVQTEEELEQHREHLEELVAERTAQLLEANERLEAEIAERAEAEAALRESEERYRTLFDGVPVGLYRTTPAGEFLDGNAALLDILGYESWEELKASSAIARYVDPQERQHWVDKLREKDVVAGFEVQIRRTDGTPIWVRHTSHAIRDDEGELLHFEGAVEDITVRKRAELQLERQNALVKLLQQIAITANEATDLEKALQLAVQQVCEFTGWPIGHVYLPADDADEVVPTAIWQLDAPAEFEAFRRATNTTTFARGVGLPGEVLATGEPAWIADIAAKPDFVRAEAAQEVALRAGFAFPVLVGPEVVAVLEFFAKEPTEPDEPLLESVAQIGTQLGRVVERRRAEEALRASEERFRSLVEHSSDLISILEIDGTIRYESDSAQRIIGYAPEELVGRNAFEFVHPDDVPHVMEAFSQIVENPNTTLETEFRFMHGDGGWRVLNATGTNRLQDPAIAGIVANSRDVTARREAEQALERYAEELKRSNEELEQFAYVASHDLQEPLRMVSSYVQLLERRYKGELDSDADDFIAYAVDGANRMQRLINDLLAYSRVGTRGKPFTPTDCGAVLGQVHMNLQPAIEEHNVLLSHDPLPTVMADEGQLVQLFQNLVSNAIKFRGEEPPRVHVAAEQRDGEWVFSVRDNGIGIDPEYRERIFVIFQRLHGREEYAGTGIGLAISKRIVDRHGGRIWVESEPGEGATFYFTLPVRENLETLNDNEETEVRS